MFEETLRHVDPSLDEAGVTVTVTNFNAAIELRAWEPTAERAVQLAVELIDNPLDAIQTHPRLVGAARAMANRIAGLSPFRPMFWHGDKQLRPVDEVFVRTMRAAGQPSSEAVPGGPLRGETVIFSAVLRVGRSSEAGDLQARVYLEGRAIDIDVDAALEEHVWDAAKRGEVLPLRLRGDWVRSDDGALHLTNPTIMALDATFVTTSGRALLEEVRREGSQFSDVDFDDMMDDIQAGRED